jgi:16S rRNA A1518/A1519 N6-dimethyltransferase RsmA/KsgA/DIM1 with predicted DNA glycosylase/AP lyase activity
MKCRLYGLYKIVHIPRLHRHPNSNSMVRNLPLKISEPLLFKPVEEKHDGRTVLIYRLFLHDIFVLKKFSHFLRVAKADISIVMYIRLSVHLSVLFHISIIMYIRLSVHLSVLLHVSIIMYIRLSVHLAILFHIVPY